MSKAEIMIVEDECIIALELSETLQSLGYNVPVLAGTGEDAVSGAQSEGLDLALIDISLGPGMDGIGSRPCPGYYDAKSDTSRCTHRPNQQRI